MQNSSVELQTPRQPLLNDSEPPSSRPGPAGMRRAGIMSADLVSLRMLLVAAPPSQQDLWRKGAAMASVPIDITIAEADGAAGTLAGDGFDLCILEADLPDADKQAVMAAARAARSAPLVFASVPRGSPRPGEVDGAMAKPASPEDARKLVEIGARTKIPTQVLIVDDSSTTRSIVRKILTASRFALDVREASEGIAALGEIASGNFGLVFLDYNMPGLNGFETLSEIRRTAPKVSVVMMTGTIDNKIADRAHASGALAFLKKPFFPTDIDAVLERHYGLHLTLR
jgi:CheY-like chemotaxis protein